MISIGSEIPAVNVTVVTPEGQEAAVASELFAGKKVVLFAVPGAFTPTCSAHHLPGYVVLADEIKAKGVDMIACISVNDAFVMKTWGEQQNAEAITMIADGGAAFTKALGLTMETGDFGGTRSQRYAMIIEDGKVTTLNVEEPKQFEVSKAETILAAL
ncbi:peroxiredoxin [Neptunomonas phycophila]|jgi:peroxiredoxin|uniref:Glutathione-dependent peroxiredoxin n=1 Tax=Neptunomonas phycophila TaxID=1572645 RepID=A0AAW7XEI0_9GAMM|nr:MULTISPECIES: peroxiredoxin [Neptunomonas]MDN2661454.1 peroxiredoxin [Neptunomonas sp. CHC150]MDO6452601.1 peroxiredoxin [Neptunomonas phycophila]MDO6783732.1 peroxiredoxin [Neptunomonas phycophila]MDP2521762.1 peroxiredoxin [Neptunomonas phycophila]